MARTQEAAPVLPNRNDEGTAGLRSRPSADTATAESGRELRSGLVTRDTNAAPVGKDRLVRLTKRNAEELLHAVGSGSAELLDEMICHCLILVLRVGESSITDDLYATAAAMGDWPQSFVDSITQGDLTALERLALALAELRTIPTGSDLH